MTHPKTNTSHEYWLALTSVKGLGGTKIKTLMAHFGTVEAIFEAELPEIAQLPSLGPVLASRILTTARNLPNFREHLRVLKDQGIRITCLEDPDYPQQLKNLPDAPGLLCSTGALTEIDEKSVAIVGTRKPTSEGIVLTLSLATQLALAGFTVVSGLAAGIDTYAHYGALAGTGKTIGVIATDLSAVSRHQNNQLATRIYEMGCLMSEHPFPARPSAANLISRNRIISGLSMATIVVESPKTGGTMHTARYAERQGRPILACRWNTQLPEHEGPQKLIKTGAFPFVPTEVDKVIKVLKHPEQLETYASGEKSEQMGLF